MADKIGVERRWHQFPGSFKSHFDIAMSKRALAVAAGAVEVDWRFAGRFIKERRERALADVPLPSPPVEVRGEVEA